jgi:hypothetical protein
VSSENAGSALRAGPAFWRLVAVVVAVALLRGLRRRDLAAVAAPRVDIAGPVEGHGHGNEVPEDPAVRERHDRGECLADPLGHGGKLGCTPRTAACGGRVRTAPGPASAWKCSGSCVGLGSHERRAGLVAPPPAIAGSHVSERGKSIMFVHRMAAVAAGAAAIVGLALAPGSTSEPVAPSSDRPVALMMTLNVGPWNNWSECHRARYEWTKRGWRTEDCVAHYDFSDDLWTYWFRATK